MVVVFVKGWGLMIGTLTTTRSCFERKSNATRRVSNALTSPNQTGELSPTPIVGIRWFATSTR